MTSIVQVQNSLSTASWLQFAACGKLNNTTLRWHPTTSSHIPQKHAVHKMSTYGYPYICTYMYILYVRLYNTVTCSLILDDYGNLEGSQLKTLLTGLEAPPNSLNPLWKEIFCMTGWSHAFPSPHATLQEGTTTQPKKHRIWQYDSIPALVTLEQSLGLESHLDRLNRFATAIVWGFRKSLKPNSPGETSIPCFGRPTFHRMAWFFEEGKLSIPSFHQSKTPRKQKRYLNI